MRPILLAATFGRRLARNRSGLALIEFAYGLPMMLVLIITGTELTNYIITEHRIRQVAAMTADNASRLRTPMTEAYLNQLFVGANKAAGNLNLATNGRLIISSVQNNAAANGQWIRWQRCTGALAVNSKYGPEGKGQSDTSLPTVGGLTAQAGSALMYAEIQYDYQPLFSAGTLPTRLKHEVAFIVRQRTDFSISGTGAATC